MRALLAERHLEIVVADRDGDRAARFAAECGAAVRALALDVTDEAALRAALAGADLVASAVGPYFRFGVPVLRAVLDAGKPYLDVCDDWAPTLEMLELDPRARERGVSAVVGLGITPGVSNLLAALCARELDEPTELVTGWDLESAMPEEVGPEPSAATLHGVEQLTGKIRVRRGGAFVDERPIRKVWVDYPGLGRRKAFTIGHPEPVTLPRTFPSVGEALNVMVARRSSIFALELLRPLVDARLVSPRRAARWAERFGGVGGRTPSVRDLVAAAERRGELGLPPLFALGRGRRGGADVAVAATLLAGPPGGIGGLTGIPLAVGVQMQLAGEIPGAGVRAPEAALDPWRFLDRLAPLCDPPRASGRELVLMTRSWEEGSLLDGLRAALD